MACKLKAQSISSMERIGCALFFMAKFMTMCPACKREILKEMEECPFCGVVISKWRPHNKVENESKEAFETQPTDQPKPFTRLIAFVVLGVVLLIGFLEWNRRQTDIISNASQPAQPAQPPQATIVLVNPSPLPGNQPSIDDRKEGSLGEKRSPEIYEVSFRESKQGLSKDIVVSVVFNDSVNATMMIDTGASNTVISPQLAERIGVFRSGDGVVLTAVQGVGGVARAGFTIIDKVQIGEASDHFVPIFISNLPSGAYEGLIGADFMAKYSMKIDQARKLVIFESLPQDANSPDGHNEYWWRQLFKMLFDYHNWLVKAGEELDKKLRKNPSARDVQSGIPLTQLKMFIDFQYAENERLLTKLDRYANEISVPSRWR